MEGSDMANASFCGQWSERPGPNCAMEIGEPAQHCKGDQQRFDSGMAGHRDVVELEGVFQGLIGLPL